MLDRCAKVLAPSNKWGLLLDATSGGGKASIFMKYKACYGFIAKAWMLQGLGGKFAGLNKPENLALMR